METERSPTTNTVRSDPAARVVPVDKTARVVKAVRVPPGKGRGDVVRAAPELPHKELIVPKVVHHKEFLKEVPVHKDKAVLRVVPVARALRRPRCRAISWAARGARACRCRCLKCHGCVAHSVE